jgi:hypothetical protein
MTLTRKALRRSHPARLARRTRVPSAESRPTRPWLAPDRAPEETYRDYLFRKDVWSASA